MSRLYQTLAAPPAGFSPSAQARALRRLLALAAVATLLAGPAVLCPRPAHSAESLAAPRPTPSPRQARRPRTMVAQPAALGAEPRA